MQYIYIDRKCWAKERITYDKINSSDIALAGMHLRRLGHDIHELHFQKKTPEK